MISPLAENSNRSFLSLWAPKATSFLQPLQRHVQSRTTAAAQQDFKKYSLGRLSPSWSPCILAEQSVSPVARLLDELINLDGVLHVINGDCLRALQRRVIGLLVMPYHALVCSGNGHYGLHLPNSSSFL